MRKQARQDRLFAIIGNCVIGAAFLLGAYLPTAATWALAGLFGIFALVGLLYLATEAGI